MKSFRNYPIWWQNQITHGNRHSADSLFTNYMKTFSKYVIQACSDNASHKILTDICDNISMYNNCWIRPKLII